MVEDFLQEAANEWQPAENGSPPHQAQDPELPEQGEPPSPSIDGLDPLAPVPQTGPEPPANATTHTTQQNPSTTNNIPPRRQVLSERDV